MVDLQTYRCRIGCFATSRKTDDPACMCKSMNGAVPFIDDLLLMSGVEPNPGPKDVLIFRYQYLAVEIGTDVLRKFFDKIVSNDFVAYLNADPAKSNYNQLQFLILNKFISDGQKKHLPPVDMKPNSSNYDITLLALLLRNVCGLRYRKDPVWTTPTPGDTSVEADITRLRLYRNELQHHGSVFMSEADVTFKWNEIRQILHRLSQNAGITQIQFDALIKKAETKDLDETLKEKLEVAIKAGYESDLDTQKRFDELDQKVAALDERVEVAEQEIKRQRTSHPSDVQKDLISMYKSKFKALPVSPLFENKDESILKMYQRPTMWSMESEKQLNEITCYKDIFYKDGIKLCNQICISGDAGMGKTTLCRFICFLWSAGKQEGQLNDEYEYFKNDIDTLRKFDFLFYINLRDTECCDVIGMIKEQYLNYHDPREIQTILRTKQCLILMDGLDEWDPKASGKGRLKLPNIMHLENCVYLMTSRPYRLESNRLSKSDCDHYIQTKGFEEKTTIKSYVNNVISYMNKENSVNKTANCFLRDVKKCGLNDHLCIPIMLSHLVVLWFEKGLTAMTRALIYGYILEMLFQRAYKREVDFPPITESKWHLPESFSGFEFLNKYVSLLYNICHLSFRSLFKLDEHSSGLVFTRQQLRSKPYCFSNEESDFLCKIGILSKNELFGWMSEEKMKISFIHKSYIELFACMFVTSFDRNSEFERVIQTLETVNEVVGFENFFILLAGLSYEKLKTSIENVYTAVSDYIDHLRSNICPDLFGGYLHLFQNMVIKCYKEIKQYNQTTIALHLEDYFFYHLYSNDEEILTELLLFNQTRIKTLHTDGEYHREFDQITTLHCLHINYIKVYDTRFTECMIRNASTLHTLCIRRSISTPPLLELPFCSLHCLTSLYLDHVRMSHDNYQSLMTSVSETVTMETIELFDVKCHTHESEKGECNFTVNIGKHSKLSTLSLRQVNITCNTVNTSSLKSVSLRPLFHSIVLSSYGDLFNCLKSSKLEQLYIYGDCIYILDDITLTTLTSTVRTLPCLKSLTLWNMTLPVGVNLLLHPDIKQTEIKLWQITISRQCFHSFIDSFKNNTSVIKVELVNCRIIRYNTMSVEESVKCMSEHLSEVHTINITYRDDRNNLLKFQTGQ